jgi:hypothetical protein
LVTAISPLVQKSAWRTRGATDAGFGTAMLGKCEFSFRGNGLSGERASKL